MMSSLERSAALKCERESMAPAGFSKEEVRKALFTSPDKMIEYAASVNLNNKLQIEQETDTALKNSQRDAHELRLKKFRETGKHLAEDDWMYPNVEKLIGLK